MEASKHVETEARPTARGGRRQRGGSGSEYFIQPAKQGQFMVLRKPCGNRVTPKLCGTMPSRSHAQALIRQLEKAESAVDDLFLEATDDGIEALEAVLAACCESVLQRGPGSPGSGSARGARQGKRGRGRRPRGRRRPPGDGGQSGSGDGSPAGRGAES
ncbi:MAG: hypothetical protein ABR499_00960 [Gemmatimonadaceae bacterium]